MVVLVCVFLCNFVMNVCMCTISLPMSTNSHRPREVLIRTPNKTQEADRKAKEAEERDRAEAKARKQARADEAERVVVEIEKIKQQRKMQVFRYTHVYGTCSCNRPSRFRGRRPHVERESVCVHTC